MSGQRFEPESASPDSLRALRRVALSRAVRVYCEDWDVPVDLACNDISRGGLFVVTASPPALHAELLVALDPRAEPDMRIKAMVTHIISPERSWLERRRPGFGALFQYVTDAQRARIDEIVLEAVNASGAQRAQPSFGPGDEPPAVDPGLAPLYAELRADLVRMKEAAPSAVLRLPEGADAAAAELAMLELSKIYHPHKFARHGSPAVTEAATQIFVLIQQAHATLLRSQKRAPAVTSAAPGPAVVTVSKRPQSVEQRNASIGPRGSGAKVTNSGAPLPSAVDSLYASLRESAARGAAQRDAVAGSSGRPLQHRSGRPDTPLDEALRHIARQRLGEAKKLLDELVASDASSRTAEVWLLVVQARLLKAEARMDEAAALYQRVLDLDAMHREAIAELRLHNARHRAAKGLTAPGSKGTRKGKGKGNG